MNPSKLNLPILGEESPTRASSGNQNHEGQKLAFEVEVVSDVICPWCYVGKRRLEKTPALLGPDVEIKVKWRPFQLNPEMPKQGIDRNVYRKAKFGSLERSQMLDARLTAVGATEGIDFHLDRISRTPNTLDAHRLIWLAQRAGRQDAIVEALFRAYFVDGVDIGQRRNLAGIAAAAGIEKALAEKFLAEEDGLSDVLAEEAHFKALGIEGVPSFVVGGVVLFSGAAEPHVLAEAFRDVHRS